MKAPKPLQKFNIGDPVFVSVFLGGLEQELAGFVTDVKFHDILREFFYSVKFFENEVFLEHFLKGDVDYCSGGLEEFVISKIEKRYE